MKPSYDSEESALFSYPKTSIFNRLPSWGGVCFGFYALELILKSIKYYYIEY